MSASSQPAKQVEIIRTRRLLDDFFKVDEAVLRHQLRNGEMSPSIRRLNLERGDGVAAVLYRPDSRSVVLVRQFRYPAHLRGDGWLLEVVAGMLDEGESPQQTMRREILEETGYAVERLELISTFYLSPGGSSERIFLYYAEVDEQLRCHAGGGLDEEHEEIEVVEMGVEEVWSELDRGGIVDAKTLIALLWLRQRLELL